MSQEARDSNTFDLHSLLYDLIQRASVRLKWRGCYTPEDCAPKLVLDYVVTRKLRRSGRCAIEGSTISINLPQARDPLHVLYKLLSFEVLAYKRTCQHCNCIDQLSEDSETNTERVHPGTIAAMDPESILEAKELFELIGSTFPNEIRRAAFEEIVIHNEPYKEVAKRFDVSIGTLRQWICRDKKKIRYLLSMSECVEQ